MPISATARHRAPYGLAFPLTELEFVRDWAIRQGMSLNILLDQVLDAAEFEELLLLRGGPAGRRALTIWRTDGSVIAQAAGAQPRAFTGIEPAVAYFLAVLAASAPRRRLRFIAWLPRIFHRIALATKRRGANV